MKRFTCCLLVFLLSLAFAHAGFAEFDPIQRGDKGERVVEVQWILAELGYLDGGVDGAFGAKTEAAVAAFQADNALDATGIVGEATYTALIRQLEPSRNAEDERGNANVSIPPAAPVESVTIIESGGDLEITDAGFDVSYGYLYFSAVIHNNNAENAILFPTVRVTARDAQGNLMGTEDQVLNLIYPGQDCQWAGMAYFEVAEEPSVVEFKALPPDEYSIVAPAALEHAEYSPLEIEGVGKNGTRFLGEVYNANDYDIDQVAVVVMFRDDAGSLLAGDATFIDSVRAGRKTPFDMDISEDLVTENYEVFAIPWSLY